MNDIDSIKDAASLKYIAEGAANVLYESSDPRYALYLLRLRKKMESQPSTLSVFRFIHNVIEPLFAPGMVASMKPVQLQQPLLEKLNAGLVELEEAGVRDKKRHGSVLDVNEPYGMLVENMTAVSVPSTLPLSQNVRIKIKGSSSVLTVVTREDKARIEQVAVMEFKPKWLCQSRDAPENWRYCRTCALRRMRAKDASEYAFCPLDLVSKSQSRVEKSVCALLPESIPIGDGALSVDILRRVLTTYIMHTRVFHTLADIQSKMDTSGVLNSSTETENFLIAMTVRDCTAFLRIIYRPADRELAAYAGHTYFEVAGTAYVCVDGLYFSVACRLADLDIKDGSGTKREYWQSIERTLIDEGWYTTLDDEFVSCR